MAVRLRLVRVGKKGRPSYRICAIDRRRQRDGAYLENIGCYDPFCADAQKRVRLKRDRAEYWISVGATPSHTVRSFLRRERVEGIGAGVPTKPQKRRKKKLSAKRIAARVVKRRKARKGAAKAASGATEAGSKDS